MECMGLVSPNGSGKSTLFRILTGDELPSAGNVYVEGKSLESDSWGFSLLSKECLSKIGYCPQYEGLIGALTGKEMLELFAKLWGVRRSRTYRIALDWMELLGLEDYENIPCSNYSGGMQRRLSLAIALIGDPAVVLLDEPYTGVDYEACKLVSNVIRDCKRSVIVSTHDLKKCETYVSTLTFVRNGRLVESCSVGTLIEKYRNAVEIASTGWNGEKSNLILESIARNLGGAVQTVWLNDNMGTSAFILYRRATESYYRHCIKQRLYLTASKYKEVQLTSDEKTLESIYLSLVHGRARVPYLEFQNQVSGVLDVDYKIFGDQKEWIKQSFGDILNRTTLVEEGADTQPNSKTSMAPSKPPSFTARSSLAIKLTNHLGSDLTSTHLHMFHGKSKCVPETVRGRTAEWFEAICHGSECSLLLSIRISERLSLRLTTYCYTNVGGNIDLCIAFTPEGVPMDDSLKNILCSCNPAVDVWKSESSTCPVEGYISSCGFLARASMNPTPKAEVRVEIVEFHKAEESKNPLVGSSVDDQRKSSQKIYLEMTKFIHTTNDGKIFTFGNHPGDDKHTFLIRLTNYLKSGLLIQGRWTRVATLDNYYLHSTIQPVQAASRTSRCFRFAGTGRQVLLSVRVTDDTSIFMFAEPMPSGLMLIGGFCPDDEPQRTLDQDYEAEDISRSFQFEPSLCRAGYESFVRHGKLLARAYVAIANANELELHVDVLDISDGSEISAQTQTQEGGFAGDELPQNELRLNGNISYRHYALWMLLAELQDSHFPYAGIIELENFLNVSLESDNEVEMFPLHGHRFLEGERVLLPEVLPFTRETFFECGSKAVKAMFSYNIASTDLSLVIGFYVQGDNNSFSAALVVSPADVSDSSLGSMLDPAQWRIHPYRKYAKASDGEQIVRDRNIRVRASMTEGKTSILSLRIYTV